jgi:UDP-2-acetamido-3-amino-2,3-dideoxy-glucuronate N-acetyltransferase
MIQATALIHPKAKIGENVMIWNWVQVRENAEIGDGTIVSKGVYIDSGVKIGRNVKIQNNVSVYNGVTIEDGVFVGPHVCFTNDKHPRAINPDGSLKSVSDWEVTPILIRTGASLGANSTILPGVTVGRFAMVGSGTVVTKNVPDYAVVVGNPARRIGWVCECGDKLDERRFCSRCRKIVAVAED